jgi:hypothetical protein
MRQNISVYVCKIFCCIDGRDQLLSGCEQPALYYHDQTIIRAISMIFSGKQL